MSWSSDSQLKEDRMTDGVGAAPLRLEISAVAELEADVAEAELEIAFEVEVTVVKRPVEALPSSVPALLPILEGRINKRVVTVESVVDKIVGSSCLRINGRRSATAMLTQKQAKTTKTKRVDCIA